jgi:hypothetical protein
MFLQLMKVKSTLLVLFLERSPDHAKEIFSVMVVVGVLSDSSLAKS